MSIERISAVTLMTADMARAVRFYRSLGFMLRHGGEESTFTTFAVGDGYLNLESRPEIGRVTPWGRVILYVSDVDAVYQRAIDLGLEPAAPPRDAPWHERYFHLSDADGHELSFAKPL